HKIINDVQDTVMSMRMVPLSPTFYKMNRIVRDMCKNLGKEVNFEVVGEDTEVDKNIIEHISDPLMHIIRNSVDHGIELPKERLNTGKPEKGTVDLEAKNSGGDDLIIVKDNGKGLDRERIMDKAMRNGLLVKPEDEYTDKEVYNFILLPGFSTNEAVTEYSGRGVGMDVVTSNIEAVGGTVIVDSTPGEGSTFTLKIPLTLAIIEGMIIKIGGTKYTIPIISIERSFKATESDLVHDPSGNEMITVRDETYNFVRLNQEFALNDGVMNIEEGIVMMLENGDQKICVLVDELIGEQQVVVKSIPKYIKKPRGISGCTLLGNGEISLIIDVAGFFDR
ncbi:MAG: chemotaxis protein CheA, partial [Clostridiales bacterium]|nr:chemotaxis protein CheA [Clostridiales bacterium]